MMRKFTLWGCDALLRASLRELYGREGKTAAGESVPKGETFEIAEALRTKNGWKSYLLDLTIQNASQKEKKCKEFAKDTKVTINQDQVLTEKDINEGKLNLITPHEYYFGLTYGAHHNFIGSREITFHGEWGVVPGKLKPRMVTEMSLADCLKYYKRILIVFP
jgi:hypothetical protein